MSLPKLTLADLARSGHVTRWHSVRTSRDQTLAEHHYMVTRISSKLARDIFGSSLTDSGLLQIMEYASLHDTPELLTGDLPSPLKWHIDQICGEHNPIDQIEHEIAPWLNQMKEEIKATHPEYLVVIKLADMIDALVFITIEGIGTHAKKVITLLQSRFSVKIQEAEEKFPQYKWELSRRVLDELLMNRDSSQLAFEKKP
ncbi:MAG: metal-dependent phosphohydrolase [Desulfobulbus propionicus]|nr:MAG: metal-dependent phosphohydrolase [Desulfobulbus propionicus]